MSEKEGHKDLRARVPFPKATVTLCRILILWCPTQMNIKKHIALLYKCCCFSHKFIYLISLPPYFNLLQGSYAFQAMAKKQTLFCLIFMFALLAHNQVIHKFPSHLTKKSLLVLFHITIFLHTLKINIY